MRRILVKNFLVGKDKDEEEDGDGMWYRHRRDNANLAKKQADKWKTFRRILKFQRLLKGLSEEYSK